MGYRSFRDSRILLTGASSGIGRALAMELARAGARLLLTARREDRLEALAKELRVVGAQVDYVCGDLVLPVTRQSLVDRVAERFGALDVLVNNAGVGAVGPFSTATPERFRQLMELNLFVPAELTRDMLPYLRQGQRALVINVGSVLGHVAVPGKSEYCASKFALRGWSNALRIELQREGLDLLLVSPSTTRSEFFDHLLETQGRVAQNRWSMSSEAVARKIYRAARSGRRELILTGSARAMIWLDFLCGRALDWGLRRFG